MNKDLCIQLLEEHVDDLNTAAKIDTVLTSRKTAKIKELQVIHGTDTTMAKGRIKELEDDNSFLVEKHFELVKDINDLRADWAIDHIDCIEELNKIQINYVGQVDELRRDFMKTLETIKERETRECAENVRLQGKIAKLQDKIVELESKLQIERTIAKNYSDEVTRLVKKNENLQEDLETAGKRITGLEADKNGHRSIANVLKKENYDMGMELKKLKKENADLRLEVFWLNPPVPVKEESK
jgi:chromosome segregation ATPase